MAASIFRVGKKWLNLSMVTWFESIPPWTVTSSEENENHPRLRVHLFGGDAILLEHDDVQGTEYPDTVAVENALTEALDALNG